MRVQAIGRVFIHFHLRCLTGLHIGGTSRGIEIGGIDNTVVRDPITNRPYVPGSSLKGKMRSLSERSSGKPKNYPRHSDVQFHVCETAEDYLKCQVCRVFGLPSEFGHASPTRLLVRDVMLSEQSERELSSAEVHTDLPYTEVKTEVAIDRVTSAANPRPLERVPAGAVFGPGEIVYTVYASDDGSCDPAQDVEMLGVVFQAMQLLEHDYLGGSGSRGSGKVAFEGIEIQVRSGDDYFRSAKPIAKFPTLQELVAASEGVLASVRGALGLPGGSGAGGHP